MHKAERQECNSCRSVLFFVLETVFCILFKEVMRESLIDNGGIDFIGKTVNQNFLDSIVAR